MAFTPLEGVRVLDLGLIVAGPMCAMYLASLGADVIRVDRPDGDWTWRAAPYVDRSGAESPDPAPGSMTLGHLRRERGKRNVALDLASPEGREAARALAETADVLIENRQRGALARLGLSREELWAVNPGLVWCSIKGYGLGDPRGDDMAIDLAVQARSGMMHRTGDPDGPPMRAGTSLADGYAGSFAALGVMAGLAERQRTGRGCLVEVALLDVLMAILWDDPLEVFAENGALRVGNRDMRGAPFDVYRASDGWAAVVATSTEQWRGVCRVIGRPELADAYPLPADRAAVRSLIDEVLGEWLAQHPAEEAERLLAAAKVPVGAVLDAVRAVDAARAVERGLMERLSVAGGVPSRFLAPRMPITFDGSYTEPAPAEPLGTSSGEGWLSRP